MAMYRQGNVLMMSVAGDQDVGEEITDPRGVVLAEGETSGHFHAVLGRGGASKLMRFRDGRADRLLEVGNGGAEVRVVGGGSGGADRHTPISLAPGKYIVRVQRAWTSAMSTMVED